MSKILSKVSFFLFLLLFTFIQSIYASDSKLVVTSDKAINDKWFQVSSNEIPNLVTTRQAFCNQDLMVLVFFVDPGINANSKAKIYYDLRITRLDGSTLAEQKHIKVIDTKIVSRKIVRLSEEIPRISLDGPSGTYLIQVIVTDEIANTVQKHQQEIELKEYVYQKNFDDYNAYCSWSESYYKNPTPENAIDGLIFYSNLDAERRSKGYAFACGFYSKILSDNPYLIPHLLTLYPDQSEDTKVVILSLLSYINYDFSEFINKLNKKEKKFYTAWQEQRCKYPVDGVQVTATKFADSIMSGYQMDMLWGTFFASGEYEPIKQLVEVLDLGQYKGNFNKYKDSKDVAYEEKATLDLIYQTAKWSIDSNCRRYSLVRDYCNFMYDNENLRLQEKQELKEIVGR